MLSTITQVIFRSNGAHRAGVITSILLWEPRKASPEEGALSWVLKAEKEFPESVWAQAE